MKQKATSSPTTEAVGTGMPRYYLGTKGNRQILGLQPQK